MDPAPIVDFENAIANVLFSNSPGDPKYADQEYINADLRAQRELVRRHKPKRG